ncbi:hypothetical protein MNBD_GAMMA13-832 [hydrothermal vent metagenome]|uniref:Uncharacterized protein n=1 Tax=hydrothermal vent metagenome TaxID=652676 RepID=A0A3B0ZME6_9ZZZZ
MQKLKILIRQSYTEAGIEEMRVIQTIINQLKHMSSGELDIELIAGAKAYSKENFKQAYEEEAGIPFCPTNFRRTRFELINACDAIVVVRTGMSESSAFELCYNIYAANAVPVFFAVMEGREIRTTLLQELDEIADVEYHYFTEPKSLKPVLLSFLTRVAYGKKMLSQSSA